MWIDGMVGFPDTLEQIIAMGHTQGFGYTGRRGASIRHGIVGVWEDEGEFADLLQKGYLDRLSQCSSGKDETLVDGWVLVYSCDKFHALTDCDPSASLDDFLSLAYLGRYEEQTDRLTLLGDNSLLELLPRHAPAYLGANLPGPLSWCEDGWTGKIGQRLDNERQFSGMHYVCDYEAQGMRCLDPWCHAEYAWVVDGLCLFYMMGSVTPLSAWFYPFRT